MTDSDPTAGAKKASAKNAKANDRAEKKRQNDVMDKIMKRKNKEIAGRRSKLSKDVASAFK